MCFTNIMLFGVYLVIGQEYFRLCQDEQHSIHRGIVDFEKSHAITRSTFLIRKQLPEYN